MAQDMELGEDGGRHRGWEAVVGGGGRDRCFDGGCDGVQKVTVSLGKSQQMHTESPKSKLEEDAVVVVKKPEEQRSQKSRGLQWSDRRVVVQHSFLSFQHSSTH